MRTVVIRPGYLETALPLLGRAAAKGRVEALGRALRASGAGERSRSAPIIMHAFSNTGFMAWGGLAHAALVEAERELDEVEGPEGGRDSGLASFSAPVEAMLRRWEALEHRELRTSRGKKDANERSSPGGGSAAWGVGVDPTGAGDLEPGHVELYGWEGAERAAGCGNARVAEVTAERDASSNGASVRRSFDSRPSSPLASERVSLGPVPALWAAVPYLVSSRRPPREETLEVLRALSRVRAGVFDSAPTLDPSGATLARGLLSALLRTDGEGLEARGRLTETVERIATGYAQTRAASSRVLEVSRAWSAAAPHDLTYLFSQEDYVIPAEDVVAAAEIEAAQGRRIALERWSEGAHVDLLRKDPRRYLDVCARVLGEVRAASQREAERLRGASKQDE